MKSILDLFAECGRSMDAKGDLPALEDEGPWCLTPLLHMTPLLRLVPPAPPAPSEVFPAFGTAAGVRDAGNYRPPARPALVLARSSLGGQSGTG